MAHTFLSLNEEATALPWPRTDDNQALWKAVDQARQHGRITMRVCYCSVFDEWLASRCGALRIVLASLARDTCPRVG
jgi:hypothetical protein